MTSADNVRSQLIGGIFIFISFIIQCDEATTPGKVSYYEDFHSNYHGNYLRQVNVETAEMMFSLVRVCVCVCVHAIRRSF